MSFTVPKGWEELTQEQLRYVIKLLWLYGEAPDWQDRVRTAAFLHFCSIEVASRTDQGWLCRERQTGKTFLLDPELLPSLLKTLDWLLKTEQMTVRIEQVDEYKAVDFELRELMFGDYLMAENFYQAFLLSKDNEALVSLAKILYRVPDGDDALCLCNEILIGAFLWYGAVKQLLSQWFPNFFKPVGEGGGSISQESQFESMQAQIRLLTKGDVTKQKYILEQTDTWTALAELDALTKEAEEIKRKYGK
ncbi:MAG: hypothetical protein J6I61_07855 [Prevotella sp.]|nr:hypothetical protein [Prevotella sp.]